ncbi:MAG: DNA adenine methylase [Verrucomicrobiia bacterium]
MQTKTVAVRAANQGKGAGRIKWRPLVAPFGYYGCKQRLSARIVCQLPPHNAWVEAFCGSAALTLAKKPAPIEVINDINGDIVNFFRQLRDHPAEIQRAVKLTPYAREELHIARAQEKNLTDLERARRFFVAAMMAINGSFGEAEGGFSFSNSYARRGMEARVSRWRTMPEYLVLVAERLHRVRIENRDALKLLDDFINRPATLVYLDPPYLGDRKAGYEHDQNSEEYHERLLKVAVRAKCMVFISGYESDLYNDYLTRARGWHKRCLKTTTRGHNGKDSEREEIIWHNQQYSHALKAGRVTLHLSAKERRYRKVNPER